MISRSGGTRHSQDNDYRYSSNICSNSVQADSTMEHIISFVECNTDAEITHIKVI